MFDQIFEYHGLAKLIYKINYTASYYINVDVVVDTDPLETSFFDSTLLLRFIHMAVCMHISCIFSAL